MPEVEGQVQHIEFPQKERSVTILFSAPTDNAIKVAQAKNAALRAIGDYYLAMFTNDSGHPPDAHERDFYAELFNPRKLDELNFGLLKSHGQQYREVPPLGKVRRFKVSF